LCNEDLEFISQKTNTPLSSLAPKAARTIEPRNANIAPEIVLDSELQIALEKMKRREYPSAIEDLRKLVRENPKSRVLRLQLAECLRLDHSPAQAIDILTKVLDEDPKDQGSPGDPRVTLHGHDTRPRSEARPRKAPAIGKQ
jgi:predicted Zn-dependent protease